MPEVGRGSSRSHVTQPLAPAGVRPADVDAEALKSELRRVWDAQAGSYDLSPGHGLLEVPVAQAWRETLRAALGDAREQGARRQRVLDVGTGTGTLALLAARLGHDVAAIDFSPEMLARARSNATAAGLAIRFAVGDAERPPFDERSFDIVMCRHVLWTLPRPEVAVDHWAALVAPGGRLVVYDMFHPRLSLPRRVIGVASEWLDVWGRRQAGGHHYTARQRLALPLAVQRDPAAGARLMAAAGLSDVRTRLLPEIDAAERAALRPIQRLGRPWRRYEATGRRLPVSALA